jgi:RNA recognition motif-containing protein
MPPYGGPGYAPYAMGPRQPNPAPRQRAQGPIHTAFFSNILFSTSLEEFTTFAGEYGEIANVYSLISTKGFAFVTYYDLRAAQKAVEQAYDRPIGGRPVRTNYAVKSSYGNRDPRTICSAVRLRSLVQGSRVSAAELANGLARFGEIRVVNPLPIPGEFSVKFFDIRAAQKLCQEGRIECAGEKFMAEFNLEDNDTPDPMPVAYPPPAQFYPAQQQLPTVLQPDVQDKLRLLRAALSKT